VSFLLIPYTYIYIYIYIYRNRMNHPNTFNTTINPAPIKLNHNVKVLLWLTGFFGIADSIWTGTIMTTLIYFLSGKSNTVVGYVEAAFGISVLLCVYLIGYYADKYSRSTVIFAGGIITIVAAITTSVVVYYAVESDLNQKHTNKVDWSIYTLGGCMAIWGVCSAIGWGPTQALYADSIPIGHRSKWYTYSWMVYLFATIIGPIITISIFQVYGDHWHPHQLRNVIWSGMIIELFCAVPMFLFDDSKALTHELNEKIDQDNIDPVALCNDNNNTIITRLDEGDLTNTIINTDKNNSCTITNITCLGIQKKHIPWICFINNLIVAIGSGMTVKYFPLFFKETCHYSPSQVQLVYIAVPISMATLSGIGTFISKYIGRIPTILLVRAIGIGLLVSMSYGVGRVKPDVLAVIYVLRTGLMNAIYPLEESILMDSVPENTRARWKGIESISQFGWCGSAVLGGILSDRYSYSFVFLITAILQLFGSLFLILIHPLMPNENHEKSEAHTVKKNVVSDNTIILKDNETGLFKQSMYSNCDNHTLNNERIPLLG